MSVSGPSSHVVAPKTKSCNVLEQTDEEIIFHACGLGKLKAHVHGAASEHNGSLCNSKNVKIATSELHKPRVAEASERTLNCVAGSQR